MRDVRDAPDAPDAPDARAAGHRGTRAVQRLVEFAPSTGGLALWVRHAGVPGRDAPLVATDGTTIRYGPGFDALPLDVQTGLVAHQVLHIGLRHAQRHLELQRAIGDVDLRLYNVCADAIVNSTLAHLGWLRLPDGSVHLQTLLERALAIRATADEALLAWDVERLYRAIDDRRRVDGDADRRGSRTSSDGGATGTASSSSASVATDGPKAAAARALGATMIADLVPDPSQRPEHEAEFARTWNERLVRAHANDGAFSLLRTLVADLPRSRTPWEAALRTRLARALSSRPALSWSRPTRSYLANQGRAGPRGSGKRLPWEPGFGGMRPAPRLAVIVDVSGSIDDDLMRRFATEVEAIVRRLEAGLVVIVGDDRVRRVTRFEPGRGRLEDLLFGGGGTDFTPLLEEADRHRPDLGIVLTDLDGPARFAPSWPVLWAVPESARGAVAPFGRTLVLR